MSSELDIALTFFFVIFVIIDIFVNVVLCKAIHRKRSLQTPMNLLIFHLAITDIVIGVFIVPRHILNYVIVYPNNTSSDYICRFFTGGSFIWTSVTAASGFLTIIALERLFAVVYPHKSKLRITKQRLKWLVVACWISSFLFNLPSQLVLKYDQDNHFCMENWPQWVSPKAYVGLAFCAGNFSVFTMFIIYSIILYSLWKKDKGASEVSRTARINARKRVTKILILMSVVHMLCRTPNYTFYTLIYFEPDAKYGSIVYNFTVFLILLNSASHPFFYCWYMDNLRRQVFAMLPQFCSGNCPSRLRSFDSVSTGDGLGSTTPEDRKGKGDSSMHSYTLGSESEGELKKMRIKTFQGRVNRDMDVNNSSSGYPSRDASPMIEKKLTVELNVGHSDCNIGELQNGDVEESEKDYLDTAVNAANNCSQTGLENDEENLLKDTNKSEKEKIQIYEENVNENKQSVAQDGTEVKCCNGDTEIIDEKCVVKEIENCDDTKKDPNENEQFIKHNDGAIETGNELIDQEKQTNKNNNKEIPCHENCILEVNV